jgi:hypothetical protein
MSKKAETKNSETQNSAAVDFASECEIFAHQDENRGGCSLCASEFAARFAACAIATKAALESKASKSVKSKAVSGRVKKQYNSLEELKAQMAKVKESPTLTFEVDRMLVAGKHTLKKIMERIDELKTTKFKDNSDFRDLTILKKHIKFRASNNRFQIEFDEKGRIQVVGVAGDGNVKFPEAKKEAAKQEERKAA